MVASDQGVGPGQNGARKGAAVTKLSLMLAGGFILAVLTGCIPARPQRPPTQAVADAQAMIHAALPAGVRDRNGWAEDLYSVFTALHITPTHEHICAVIAVAEQESDLSVDPVIPGLGRIAWREIDKDAAHAGIPGPVVHEVLKLESPNGLTYEERIDAARTEKELSRIYEDFTGSIPLGRTLFASWNPIRTRGPMQVNVAFAHKFQAVRPYPYPLTVSLDDELFTRRGSLYFGTAHLLAYSAPYDSYLYRFADYNAGQFASRNAAFQNALSAAAGVTVVPDGALVVPNAPISQPSDTELAARKLAARLRLDRAQIHAALEQDRDASFQNTDLYRRVFALAARARKQSLPKASLPRIDLQGPKLHSHLTTAWYAQRVQARFERCLARVQ
jgi:hypothetical protein